MGVTNRFTCSVIDRATPLAASCQRSLSSGIANISERNYFLSFTTGFKSARMDHATGVADYLPHVLGCFRRDPDKLVRKPSRMARRYTGRRFTDWNESCWSEVAAAGVMWFIAL